jgi:hypothetical protein
MRQGMKPAGERQFSTNLSSNTHFVLFAFWFVEPTVDNCIGSDMGTAPARKRGSDTYRTLKFVGDSFGLDSVLLTEGSILDSCYEIWAQLSF